MRDDGHLTQLEQATAETGALSRPHRVAALALGAIVFVGVAASLAARQPGHAGALGTAAAIATALAAAGAIWRISRLGRAARRLAQLSRIDPESGLPGPLALDQELKRELAASLRSRSPLALVMVDLDDLRPLHLERGLAAGRRLVSQAAEALEAAAVAHGGRAFRAHGTALVAMLPGSTHAEAERLAQRLGPSLELLSRRTGGRARLVAGGTVALAGDLPEDVVLRAAKRCASARAGSGEESPPVRPATTSTH